MSSHAPRFDQDGDVEMAVAQPIFEFIKAPRLAVWSQQALVKFLRDRRQYETKMAERCRATSEAYDTVVVSIKSSLEPRVLDHVARFFVRKDPFDVIDAEILQQMERKAGAMLNQQVPDIPKLFEAQLKMDLQEPDIEARVTKFFIDFQRIVEDNGLVSVMGQGPIHTEKDRVRMKLRCKTLVDCVQPEMLRTELTRMIKWTETEAKYDELALHDLILRRATEQQLHHVMARESKASGQKGRVVPPAATKPKPKAPTTGGTAPGTAPQPRAPRPPPADGCLACGGQHWLSDCSQTSPERKAQLIQEMRDRRRSKVKVASIDAGGSNRKSVILNGILEVPFCADTGADRNIVSRRVVNELLELDVALGLSDLVPPVKIVAAGGLEMVCRQAVQLDLRIETAAGPVHVSHVECLILEQNEDEFILGRPTMQELGIDIDRMFEQLAVRNDSAADAAADDIADEFVDPLGGVVMTDLEDAFKRMVTEASDNGMSAGSVDDLTGLVHEYQDVWRLHVGADEAARVEPLEVRLLPGSTPTRSPVRRYPEDQRAFLRQYVRELEAAGLVFRNNSSRWASPALPIRKQGTNEYRITVDYRTVNAMIEPIAGAAPNLNVVTQAVRGSCAFGTFDFFKGFWQMPLHPKSQEIFSFVTEDGVFTPVRVPQGATDSAVHFQGQMHRVFRDELHDSVLVWIDDILLFARSEQDYLERLRVFFQLVRKHNLKLNAKKCKLYATRVVWCGKVVDGEGVEHDPSRLEALRQIPLPPTGAALQNFLCALNWLRDSLVDYSRTVGPLQRKLEKVMAERGRKKTQLRGAHLSWTSDEEDAFQIVLAMMERSCKQFFPDPEAELCLFTDASMDGWAAIVTQVKEWKDGAPVADQRHELLVCRGGAFKGAQLNWSVAEKEGYPIVRTSVDLDYLLDRPRGYRIFCDHANLIQIFAPGKEVKQHVKGKLLRWALKLGGSRYQIEHISGEMNVWADMVSRWGQPTAKTSAVKRVTTRSVAQVSQLRPLQDDGFVWPRPADIITAQAEFRAMAPPNSVEVDGMLTVDTKIWLPHEAVGLLQRILVIAHAGGQGHRGANVMEELVDRRFVMSGLRATVTRFVNDCLLCKHVKGGHVIYREPTVDRSVTKRNECLHLDYLYLGESYGTTKYILVLKDELTHYCELVPADATTSEVAVESILDWNKRFGLPEVWMSDKGSHFKSSVMSELSQRLGTTHMFVPVYTPWINGTVERVNRDVLQVLRVMLLELQLDTRNWVYLLPLIQANLNHSPVQSLGGCAPIELFTGLPAGSALDTVAVPGERGTRVLPVDVAQWQRALTKLRESLAALHRPVVDARQRRRLLAQANAKGSACNFSVGDFVLWSRVDKRLADRKLYARWVGPFRVVEAFPHSFMVEHLLTGDRYDVHGSRLKYYSDADLEVDVELREHVALQGLVLDVRGIVGHRFNRASGEHELNIAWRGLQDEENSWEPFAAINTDVPALVRQYVEAHAVAELQQLL